MKKYRRLLSLLCLFALLMPPALVAQTPAPARKFELTVDNIMRGPALVGYEPSQVRWSQDGRRVYFRWKRADEPRLKEPDTYVVGRDGADLRRLTEDEARAAPPASGDLSKDRRLTVYVEDGDIHLHDHAKGERRQITSTVDGENNARLTGDQRAVSFTRQNNLYKIPLDGGSLIQLTDIRTGGADPSPARGPAAGGFARGSSSSPPQRGNESQEQLRKQERELIEAVRERAERREEQEARRKQRETRQPFNLPAGQSVANLILSPDEKYALVSVLQPPSGAKSAIVPNYVTESGYTEDIPSRSKVGDAQNRSRLAVIEIASGNLRWVDHGQKMVERSPDLKDVKEAKEANAASPRREAARERDVQFFNAQWSEDGRRAVALARASDNKDRWVMLIDPATGKTKVLDHLHDDAWVGGPGSFTLGWLPDHKRVYFQTERDGYAHLYTVDVETSEARQITSGKYEVSDVRLSEDRTKFYFTSSEVGPEERHLYAMGFDGGARTKLTSLPGNNEAVVSPDGAMVAIIRSYSNRPPELYLAPKAPGGAARQVTNSPSPEFFTYDWSDPPIVTFRARDGVAVPARLYRPAGFRRGGPAVIFVHGAGYLQNVHKWWSSYYREYMFHHLLMERGFLVLDVDYRGSAGYGRDWRTAIYRHMGGKDLTDHVDAAQYLTSEHGVDPKRIGIYGGSYGGFITLMAMFTTESFAAGAALRPVTDWAHYNHGYTSNILNAPQADVEAYQRSSPIHFAAGLKGALLICHGMVDVNVHFQDTVRLVQRLIELRKENWELAVYPVEDHAFVQPASWADEYKRILKLFVRLQEANAAPAIPARRR